MKLLLTRVFFGWAGLFIALPLLMLMDGMGIGGRNEEIVIPALLALGWGLPEGLIRRSGVAALLTGGVAAFIALVAAQLLAATTLAIPTIAAVSVCIGLGLTAGCLEPTRVGWRVFWYGAAAVLAVAGALDLVLFDRESASIAILLFGALPQFGAWLALRREPQYLDAKPMQYTLAAIMALVVLLAAEVTIALKYYDLGPRTPYHAEQLERQGKRARQALDTWRPGEKRPAAIDDFLLSACREGKDLEFVQRILGPAKVAHNGYAWCLNDADESRPVVIFTELPAGTIAMVKGHGETDELFIASARDMHDHRWGRFALIILACLPVNFLIVHFVGRRLKRRDG